MPKLIFTGEHFAGLVYELTLERTTVGRGERNTLVLNHPSVSQIHCEILLHGPEVIVRDLGTANDTYVNGKRLHRQQYQMKSGQMIRFGSVHARLDLELPNSENTDYDETAVFDARRITREQRREEQAPKPTSAAATFGSSAASNRDLKTVLLPPAVPSKPVSTTPVPKLPEVSCRKHKSRILPVAALLLGFAILLWLIWARK